VVERHNRAAVIALFCGEPLAEGELRLGEAQTQHARVRRVERGDQLRLLDGRGRVADAKVLTVDKKEMSVSVGRIIEIPKPGPLEVVVPVADRDRMLLAAEKCVELQITAWRPAHFARSRSVSPRGEGDKFHERVRARMQSALEQSGGAWLPDLHEEADASEVMNKIPADWNRMLLDSTGALMTSLVQNRSTSIAVGPEGGLEQRELEAAQDLGWRVASIGETTLRFETALIGGAAIVRAAQPSSRRT
jgi:16S rRNA (uracil1498-N3)-methyltransferase